MPWLGFQVPCVIKLSLAGFECVGAVDPKKRESPRLLGSFPINELVLTKSKSTTMCIVSKGYARAEAGGPEWLRPINTLYVFTAASFEDASTLCAAAVDLRQSWDDHVKTIVLRNFTEAQVCGGAAISTASSWRVCILLLCSILLSTSLCPTAVVNFSPIVVY